MALTEQEHQALLDSYNSSQAQLEADREILERESARAIIAAADTYDLEGLATEFQRILNTSVSGGRYNNTLTPLIGVLNIINSISLPEEPIILDPEPDPEPE